MTVTTVPLRSGLVSSSSLFTWSDSQHSPPSSSTSAPRNGRSTTLLLNRFISSCGLYKNIHVNFLHNIKTSTRHTVNMFPTCNFLSTSSFFLLPSSFFLHSKVRPSFRFSVCGVEARVSYVLGTMGNAEEVDGVR